MDIKLKGLNFYITSEDKATKKAIRVPDSVLGTCYGRPVIPEISAFEEAVSLSLFQQQN